MHRLLARRAAARLAAAALLGASSLARALSAQGAAPAAAPAPAPAARGALPLVPLPREAAALPAFPVGRGVAVVSGGSADDAHAARDLGDALRARGVPVVAAPAAGGVTVHLLRRDTPSGGEALRRAGLTFDAAMQEEGFVLVARDGRVDVVAATAAGVFYGAQTVKQLVEGSGASARVLGARVRDWPAMRWRGVHVDLSRGPVSALEFQKRQVRTLAAFKVNAYAPYLEHTLVYASQPLIGPPGGAITAEEARELTAYARRYHVEMIPEGQAFGHLHHVLKWERYSPLGETPHGQVLAPGQAGSIPLVKTMFADLAAAFPSRFLHIGADETFELGRGQTGDRVRREGIGPVYLGFLGQAAEALRPLDRRLLFWGDIAMNHAELVRTLPRDLVAVAWWYDPAASFDKYVKPFRDAGMETWVAPGANNWSRVYPNYANALANIRGFARDGQRLGATGLLNTTWNDDGESLLAQTWGALLFGAAAAWQPGESSVEAFMAAYPRAFHGDTAGHVAAAERALQEAHELLRTTGLGDGSDYLFWLDPWSPEGRHYSTRVLPVASRLRLLAEDAIEHLAYARRTGATREPEALDAMEVGARRMDLIGMKFQLADEIVRIYGRISAMSRDSAQARQLRWYDFADVSGINGRYQTLRDAYTLAGELYEQAWRRENRPYWLGNVMARYQLATQLWVRRNDEFAQVRTRWARTREVPTASSLGIPEVPAGR